MKKKIHKLFFVYYWVMCLSGICSGKSSFYEHDEGEEREMIEFAKTHPEIDFAAYNSYPYSGQAREADFFPFIQYAAACNYPNLLAYLEKSSRAVSRYTLGESEPSPIETAINQGADDSVDFLGKVRPDWLSSSGWAPVETAMAHDNVQLMRKFIDFGFDVNAYRGFMDSTWMDNSLTKSLEMYELIRSQGGRFSVGIGWPLPLRKQLLEKYAGEMCHLYTNGMIFPDGTRVDYEMEGDNSRQLSAPAMYALEHALENVGMRCKGTMLMVFHTQNPFEVRFDIQSILDRLNLAVLCIPEGMEKKTEEWPKPVLHVFFPKVVSDYRN